MEIFLDKAKQSLRESDSAAMMQIAHVAALGVACLENKA
jgi:hypothetical protein